MKYSFPFKFPKLKFPNIDFSNLKSKKALPLIKEVLLTKTEWNNDALFASLKSLAETNEMKNGQILYPARIAFSGLETTPGGATELAVVLGKDECLKRIDAAIKKLS